MLLVRSMNTNIQFLFMHGRYGTMRDNVISLKVSYQHLTFRNSRFVTFNTKLSWILITIIKIQRFSDQEKILGSFCDCSGENSHIKALNFVRCMKELGH